MRIGLVAGESSGDLLAAGLIEAIRERHADARFEGVAGPAMIAAGCQPWADADELAVMGLIEPLKHLPRLLKLRRSLVDRWTREPPDVFVGVDAPDFNLGLEKALKQSGVRTAHYVSPSVWAWRSGRIKTMREAADLVLCLLPFEPELYRDAGVEAVFVGHPKAGQLAPPESADAAKRRLSLDASKPVIALLPGSRGSEVSRLVETFMAAAAKLLAADARLQFVLPVARPKLKPQIEAAMARHGLADAVHLLDGQSIEAMEAADLVILASGTAVLEAALLGKPCIALYRLAPLSAFIVRRFKLLKLDYVTLPNNLTSEPLVPELLQEQAEPDALFREAKALLDDAPRRAAIRDGFAKLREELAQDASERAADAILRLAGK